MARCKDCDYFEDCKKLGEMHWDHGVYPDDENNVENLCGAFEIKTEREKDMVSCKECANGEVCGDVMEKGAENAKISESAPSKEWQKEKEIEERILRIKATGYDAIKKIVEEHMKEDYPFEETFAQIDGVMRREEAVAKNLI